VDGPFPGSLRPPVTAGATVSNFVKIHKTLRVTPAMEARFSDQVGRSKKLWRAGIKMTHFLPGG
jgi:hypothetical protein